MSLKSELEEERNRTDYYQSWKVLYKYTYDDNVLIETVTATCKGNATEVVLNKLGVGREDIEIIDRIKL